ncbi:LysM peptidoglycan-binding domain-containing protein [Marinilactibacillus psychrotolerans]|uniref:LysM peptidoglycan-binding domain-containing protein n=1 Tax=Marinilactibacillus psychrotolerans TaxID=191770 RepID=UPI00381AB54A
MMTRQQTVQRKVLRKVKKNWVTVAIAGLIASNLVAPATASAQSWTARTPEEISQDIQGYKTVKDLSTYQIVWGDTLWGLSQASGFSISEFISAFGIQNPNLIYAGNRLGESSVGFTPSRTKSAEGTYKVVYGDTLSSIAASFDTTVERLVSWNNIMNQDLIFPGQNLRVTENAQIAESDKTETEEAQVAESATTETEKAQNDVKENTPVTGSEDETETVVDQPVISDDETDYDNVEEPVDEEDNSEPVDETPEEETPSEPDQPVDEENDSEPVDELTRNEIFFNAIRAELGNDAEHVRFSKSTWADEPKWDVRLDLNSTEMMDIEGEQNPFPTQEEMLAASKNVESYLNAQGYEFFLGEGMVSNSFFIDLDNPNPAQPTEPVEETPSEPVDETPIEEETPSEPGEEVLTKEEQFIEDINAALPDVSAQFIFGDAQSRDVDENLDVYLSIQWEDEMEATKEGEQASARVEQYLNDKGFDYFVGKGMGEHIFFIDVDSVL